MAGLPRGAVWSTILPRSIKKDTTIQPDGSGHPAPFKSRAAISHGLPRRSLYMHLARLALIPAAVLLVAACSPGGATPGAPSAATSSAPSASAAATRIQVTLTDALKIEPAAMTVRAGAPITFVVTNSGATDHEFYLGDEAAQAEHEKEMAAMGEMGHDEPEGISVKPGETNELIYTFSQPGETLAGCHVVGHYGGGMKARITVEGSP